MAKDFGKPQPSAPPYGEQFQGEGPVKQKPHHAFDFPPFHAVSLFRLLPTSLCFFNNTIFTIHLDIKGRLVYFLVRKDGNHYYALCIKKSLS